MIWESLGRPDLGQQRPGDSGLLELDCGQSLVIMGIRSRVLAGSLIQIGQLVGEGHVGHVEFGVSRGTRIGRKIQSR